MSDRETVAQGRVNVNTASFESLRDDVIGFGEVLAERIVAYRDEHGPFHTLEDMTAIKGIGGRLIERLSDQLTISVQNASPPLHVESVTVAPEPAAEERTASVPVLEEDAMTETDTQGHIPEPDDVEPVAPDHDREDEMTAQPAEIAAVAEDIVVEVEAVADDAVEDASEIVSGDVDEAVDDIEDAIPASDIIDEAEVVSEDIDTVVTETVDEVEDAIPASDIVDEAAAETVVEAGDDDKEITGEVTTVPVRVVDAEDDDWLADEDELGLEWPGEQDEWDEDELEDLTPEEMAELDRLIEQDLEIDAIGTVDADLDSVDVLEETPAESTKAPDLDEILGRDDAPEAAVLEAVRSSEEDTMSAVHEAAPMSPMAGAPAMEKAPRQKKRRPSSLLMVLLGGLLGVALTLLVGIILSGTVDFAPRRQVDALSRNMGTMQANSELAWERLDVLDARANEIDRHLTRLDAMADTVATLEGDIAAAQAELGSLETSLDTLSTQVTELSEAVEATDTRVTGVEGQVSELAGTVTMLEGSVEEVQGYVNRFDGFFSALRDLLMDMQGVPEAEVVAE